MHKESQLICLDPSLTQQSFYEKSLISNIMDFYNHTGMWSDKVLHEYVPMETPPICDDFREAQEILLKGKAAFDSLPEVWKSRCGGNPSNFLAFISDSANHAQCVELGIFNKPAEAPSADARSADVGNTSHIGA
jgi:Chlamydia-phage Chp2 scaffold (Chlamy_scaf)